MKVKRNLKTIALSVSIVVVPTNELKSPKQSCMLLKKITKSKILHVLKKEIKHSISLNLFPIFLAEYFIDNGKIREFF
jgi:hypothetical protein